jgi:ketosteroid isomerase-like protein
MTTCLPAQRVLVLAAAALLGATVAAAQAADLEARVDQAQQRYEEAWTGGDADTLAELHSEDAIVWPPTGGVHEGRDAIRSYFEEAPRPQSIDIRSEMTERLGEFILDVGTFTGTQAADAGGGPLEGEYVVIARESEGELQLYRVFAGPRRQSPQER